MKRNLKTYAEITEIHDTETFIKKEAPEDNYRMVYIVKFITTYDVYVLGKFIKTESIEKMVPFSFESLNKAKDFCSIHPTSIKEKSFEGPDSWWSDHGVEYKTYEIQIKTDNYTYKVYAIWDYYSVKQIENSGIITFQHGEPYPLIKEFAKDIKLKTWFNTFSKDDVKIIGGHDKLSSLLVNITNDTTNYKKWKFELVSNG